MLERCKIGIGNEDAGRNIRFCITRQPIVRDFGNTKVKVISMNNVRPVLSVPTVRIVRKQQRDMCGRIRWSGRKAILPVSDCVYIAFFPFAKRALPSRDALSGFFDKLKCG